LIFIFHPIHSEAVANIKGRDEILALILCLGVLYFSLRAASSKKNYWLIMSAGVFLLALLAKENAVTYLVVVGLCLWFFTESSLKRILVILIPLVSAVVVYIGIRYSVLGYFLYSGKEVTGLMNNPFLEAAVSEKYATIFYTLGLYVKLLFFPYRLTHDYYPYHIALVGWSDPRAWGSLLLCVLLAGYALLNFKKKSTIAFGILYFVITLSVVSNLAVPIGTFMNERFMFMPSVGFCIVLGFWLSRKVPALLKKDIRLGRSLVIFLLLVIIIGYGVRTVTRVPAWKDTMSLNRAGVKVSAGSGRANCFMGYALYDKAFTSKESHDRQVELFKEAEYYIDRALSIYPAYINALNIKAGILGGYFQYDGEMDKLLGGFYEIIRAGHVPFVFECLEYLNRRGQDVDKLMDFYHRAGFELVASGQKNYPLALRYLDYGYRLDPNNVQILLDFTKVYYIQKDYRKALEVARLGLSIEPGHVELGRYFKLASSRD
jgi:hypothetical protein